MIVAFEHRVPVADLTTLVHLATAHASVSEIERTVQAMVGDLGFVPFAKLAQRPLVSLLGKRKKLTVYLLGNPVLANRMFEQHPAIGLYAPLCASIYEDYGGVSHFTYDRPSSLLQQFNHEDVMAVVRLLDERMSQLADYVTGRN
jgi:uncharacterized protein (DUF302 family)